MKIIGPAVKSAGGTRGGTQEETGPQDFFCESLR
jgi:hypothetical protein